ncbi:transcription termination factor 1, mitochondrial [Esox lucius]|uniref:Mitochondrial transcription termination factor 1 n=2 Tax=Esox lucius TaxID=8010 RepID=A0A3P8YEA1_ESOLU|nr:transcription termination factor 1, mitochondrial [Esox lucius]
MVSRHVLSLMTMTLVPGVRALWSLHRTSVRAISCFVASPTHLFSVDIPRGLCTISANTSELKPLAGRENELLLESLTFMGVDVKMARQRQPGVLRKFITNEQGLANFLHGKGASRKVVASIISRYPRAITRTGEHLEQRWALWRGIFKSDQEIINILDRSPESFFRSSDNDNLEKNIVFLSSLGLDAKDLHRLLTTAPRTFSNSVELNRQMVKFLEDMSAELGGQDHRQFAKAVISRNLYILIRSTKRVKANIDFLKGSFNISDPELLALLQGTGAEILDLSNEYLKRNLKRLQEKMMSLGCQKANVKKLIICYPTVLFIGPDTLSSKLDCLLKRGISMAQILEKPKVLEYSTQNITQRLEELTKLQYDFKKNGINILDMSRKRFDAKLERLALLSDE